MNRSNNATSNLRSLASSSDPKQEMSSTPALYRDFLHVPASRIKELVALPPAKRRGPRGGVLAPFPEKLYAVLKQAAQENTDGVVSWQTHGRCFFIHQPQAFVDLILPRFFRQTKLASFQRQLNLYGFSRLTSGRDRGGYYHELFLRGRPDLLKLLLRTRLDVTSPAKPSSQDRRPEPNLWSYPPAEKSDDFSATTQPSKPNEMDCKQSSPSPVLSSFHSAIRAAPILPTHPSSLANVQQLQRPPQLRDAGAGNILPRLTPQRVASSSTCADNKFIKQQQALQPGHADQKQNQNDAFPPSMAIIPAFDEQSLRVFPSSSVDRNQMRVSSDFMSAAKGGRDLSCTVADGCSASQRTAGERTRELGTNVSTSSLAQTVSDFLAHLDTGGYAHSVNSSNIPSSQPVSGISSKCDDQKLSSSKIDKDFGWEENPSVQVSASADKKSHMKLDVTEDEFKKSIEMFLPNRSKNRGNMTSGSNITAYLHHTLQPSLPFLNEMSSNETLSQLINRILGKPDASTAVSNASSSRNFQTANKSAVTGATVGTGLEDDSLVNGLESLPDPGDSEAGSEVSTAQFAGLEFKTIGSHELQAYEKLMVSSDLGKESPNPVSLDQSENG